MQATTTCPFCHAAEHDVIRYETYPVRYTILCLHCDARGPSAATPDAARSAWADRKPRVARRCVGCGAAFEARNRKQTYCSRRCVNDVSQRRWRQRQQALAYAQAWDEVSA